MAAILGAIQAATSAVLGTGDLSIDNWTFKLFYQWTVTILMGFSVLVSCNQFFGDPIQCDMPGEGVSEKVLKSYCWMYSTFNIPEEYEGKCARRSQSDDPMYNSYYQWVAIFLIFQAMFFYSPRVIWLMMEGGLMKFLAKNKTERIIEDSEEKLDTLLRVFRDNLQNKYNRYTFIFFGCEILNFVVVLSQIFITDLFLQGQFLSYGPNVLRFYRMPPEEAELSHVLNPMCEAFPRIASCTFYKKGTAGGPVGLDALCILSLNIVIDKIYLVLWFWFMTIMILCGIRILCRVAQMVSVQVRFFLMKLKMQRYFKDNENTEYIKAHIKDCTIGDWFVLYQMSKNLNKRFFHDFLIRLSREGKEK